MHGKNEVASPMYRSGGELLVHEKPWYTIQGEGPDAGCPAVFVRLAKCNLRCFFCDTEFEDGVLFTWRDLYSLIEAELNRCVTRRSELVVITGGEPLLQNIMPLVTALNTMDIRVAVETAGTVMPANIADAFGEKWYINSIVCSPKTPKINVGLLPYITAFKYIVAKDDESRADGLPVLGTQINTSQTAIPVYRPDDLEHYEIFVQGRDEGPGREGATLDNMKHAAAIAMKYGYRVSVQTHKILGVP